MNRCLWNSLVLLTINLTPGLVWGASSELENLLIETDSNNSANVPIVLTATRLDLPQTEVPASITILDRETILGSGVRNLADLMRLVPGMSVMARSGNEWIVSYHGSSFRHSRRMQVLVDGRALFQPAMASMRWNSMPVALENIERIEIVRGPNAASYGANSFLGTINIISRHPVDTQGSQVKLRLGNRDTQDYYLQHSGNSSLGQFRLSLFGRKDSGFDWDLDKRQDPVFKTQPDYLKTRRDSSDSNSFNLSVNQQWSARDELSWQLGHFDGLNEFDKEDYDIQLSHPDFNDTHSFGLVKWQHQVNPEHSFHWQAYMTQTKRESSWDTCLPRFVFNTDLAQLYRLDPGYVDQLLGFLVGGGANPFGQPGKQQQDTLAQSIIQAYPQLSMAMQPLCGRANSDITERRYDLEFQDTWVVNSALQLLSGVGVRHEQGRSETYLNGDVDNQIYRVFGHLQYRMAADWLLNFSGTYESEQQNGDYWSPRLALNYLLTPQQSVRAIYSTAVRTPDMLEQQADWSYRLHQVVDAPQTGELRYYQSLQGQQSLQAERIRSHEVGYYGQFETSWGSWQTDIKAFYDELDRVISENFAFPSYRPSNDNWIRMHGTEAMLVWRPEPSHSLRWVFSLLDSDSSFDQETEFTPNKSLSFLYQKQLPQNWQFSSGYYLTHYMAQMTDGRRLAYDRLDMRLAKKLEWSSGQSLELAWVVQHQLNDDNGLFERNANSSRNTTYVSAEMGF